MYDFKKQKEMLYAAHLLLKEKKLLDITAFGGGTALAVCYWNHRFSSDIDMFMYGEENLIMNLRESNWNKTIEDKFKTIGYKKGNMINHPAYLEFKITQEEKVQFLDVKKKTEIPFIEKEVFGININVESINEILAKKIFFRGNKGNSRDIYDIAIGLHKNPLLFRELNLPLEKYIILNEKLNEINNDENQIAIYKNDILEMSPSNEYKILAQFGCQYIEEFLNDYIAMKELGQELEDDEYIILEDNIYEDFQEKYQTLCTKTSQGLKT